MSVDTYILLPDPPDLIDLLRYFDGKYRQAKLCVNGENSFGIAFHDGDDNRFLYVCPPGVCSGDYADITTKPAILISMGCWGNSEMIARRCAVKFGGFIKPNDCTDDWTKP